MTADKHELSIEELEAGVKADPNDVELKKDLAYAILDRYVYKKDLKRLRTLVKEMPEPVSTVARAFLFYADKKYEESVNWLVIYAADRSLADGETLTCDELLHFFIDPYSDAKREFWMKLSEATDRIFPSSAAAYCVKAMASAGDTDAQVTCYKQALDKDNTYWIAAWALGDLYRRERNWQSAVGFYEKALQFERPKDFPLLYLNDAWCLGKLMRYEEEEEQLRACLKLDPEFESARNNLGWSLFKQRKYQEALSMFDEAIKLGVDGKHPFYNRARALKGLKRYRAAVNAWQAVKPYPGRVTWIDNEVWRLLGLINLQSLAQTEESTEDKNFPNFTMLGPVDDSGQPCIISEEARLEYHHRLYQDHEKHMAIDAESDGAIAPKEFVRRKESMLEEKIVKLIRDGKNVFGRKLQMYGSAPGCYGRQVTIPGYGQIDLLTEDAESGELVIIEFKRDETHDVAVGQILMWMNWVRENMAMENQNVIGAICVFSITPKLQLAARNNPNIELFEYDLAFEKA